MPYVPKRHAQWIGLVELVELVKTESGCSLEAAHDQIRNALAEGAICPLDWEPAPAASWLCQVRYGSPHHIYRMPLYPPPLPPEICPCFIDARRALHWQDVEINWGKGRVLDDFEHDADLHMSPALWSLLGGRRLLGLKPSHPEWRTLWLDRKACERIWHQPKSRQGDQSASFRPGNPDGQWSPTGAPISEALLTGAIQSPEPEEMPASATAETAETENVDIAKASSEVAIATLTGAIQSPEPEEMPASATAKTTETENVDVAPPEPVHTIARETECQVWLVKLMRNGSIPGKRKREYRDEALKLYGTSARAFIRAWRSAITKTGNKNWSRAGRKSGSRSHEKS